MLPNNVMHSHSANAAHAHYQVGLLAGFLGLIWATPAAAYEADSWRGQAVVGDMHWQLVIQHTVTLLVAEAPQAATPPPPPLPAGIDELSPHEQRIRWLKRMQRLDAENANRMRMSREERLRLRVDIREAGHQVYVPGAGVGAVAGQGNSQGHGFQPQAQPIPNPSSGSGPR